MPETSFLELLRPYSDDVCLFSGRGPEADILKAQLLTKLSPDSLLAGNTPGKALEALAETETHAADVVFADLRGIESTEIEQFLAQLPTVLREGGRAICLLPTEESGQAVRDEKNGAYSAILEEDLGTGWMIWVRKALTGC